MAAENAARKVRRQPHLGQLHLDLETVGPRGTGNAPVMVGVHALDGAVDVLDGGELRLQRGVAACVEGRHPFVGQRAAGVVLNARRLAAHRLADEEAHALFGRQHPTGLGQHVAQHAVGDGLAVYQHTVAVKQDCFKFHSC